MTELELSTCLGIMPDPEKNRVPMDPLFEAEIGYLSQIFAIINNQKAAIGSVNPDIWCELLPWHSMN